jgi:hypothetical protein
MRPNLTYQNHFDGAPLSVAFQLSQRALKGMGGGIQCTEAAFF